MQIQPHIEIIVSVHFYSQSSERESYSLCFGYGRWCASECSETGSSNDIFTHDNLKPTEIAKPDVNFFKICMDKLFLGCFE